jgi:hypothetical protein
VALAFKLLLKFQSSEDKLIQQKKGQILIWPGIYIWFGYASANSCVKASSTNILPQCSQTITFLR